MTSPLLTLLAVAALLGLTVIVALLRAADPEPRVTETLRPPPAEPGRLWPVAHLCPPDDHVCTLRAPSYSGERATCCASAKPCDGCGSSGTNGGAS